LLGRPQTVSLPNIPRPANASSVFVKGGRVCREVVMQIAGEAADRFASQTFLGLRMRQVFL
jgi:hypothetical protein